MDTDDGSERTQVWICQLGVRVGGMMRLSPLKGKPPFSTLPSLLPSQTEISSSITRRVLHWEKAVIVGGTDILDNFTLSTLMLPHIYMLVLWRRSRAHFPRATGPVRTTLGPRPPWSVRSVSSFFGCVCPRACIFVCPFVCLFTVCLFAV